MNSKNKAIKVISWILTIFNLCASVYYLVDSHKNRGKIKKMQRRLSTIKNDLHDIADELNELAEEIDDELGEKKDDDKVTETELSVDDDIDEGIEDVADIDSVPEDTDEEKVEE